MTEKRFTVPVKYCFSHSKIQLNGEPLTNDELVRILNTNDGAFFENFSLKQENEQLKKEIEELEFKLRTIESYDRTEKEEFSDTVYDFKKKLEKW